MALAYIYMIIGDHDSAIDQLQTILNINGGITLDHIDNLPEWSQLKKHPRIIKWNKTKQQS